MNGGRGNPSTNTGQARALDDRGGCSGVLNCHTIPLMERARTSFLADDHVDQRAVRVPILESWSRARGTNLPADRVELAFEPGAASDSPLVRAATQVVREAADQLASEPISVILCDDDGVILERCTGDSSLRQHLDKVWLAPGFSYAESVIGTNGIGTALHDRGPVQVFGHEHYLEALTGLACAGHPIRHPVSGALLGVIDLTGWSRDASNVMLTAAFTMARRIEENLLDQAGRGEVALLHEYLAACERSYSAVYAVGDGLLMMNEQASTLLATGDQAPLLAEAAEALASGYRRQLLVDLPSGATARVHCWPSSTGEGTRSGILKVNLIAQRTQPSAPRYAAAASTTIGSVGSGALWTKCSQAVDRHVLAGEWLILEGEPGAGKSTLALAAHRRHTPTDRLRVLDAADTAWISTVGDELAAGGGTLLLRHLDQLDEAAAQELADALEPHRASTDAGRLRVIATFTGRRTQTHGRLAPLLNAFPHSVEVPPLRYHIEDVAELVPNLVGRLGGGAHLIFSPHVMRLLMRNHWPGNVEQLRRVLSKIISKRRTGMVTLSDLPSECRSITRRILTPVEAIERDAIIEALVNNGDNKAEAAREIGMSRATIYRKIRDYGIVVCLPVDDGTVPIFVGNATR